MKDNRFLTKNDYCEVIQESTLDQIVKPEDEYKYQLAESSAEMSVLEYLRENYEIEQVLEEGKSIGEYDRRLTYPVGSHLEIEEKPYKVIRSISGYKKPSSVVYWEEYVDYSEMIDIEKVRPYKQLDTFQIDDLAMFNGIIYICRKENGYEYGDIRIPGVDGWEKVEVEDWQPVVYEINTPVRFNGKYYMLYSLNHYDETIKPAWLSNCWGEIADYDDTYNQYEFADTEFVVYEGELYRPVMNPNSDVVEVGKNVILHDPRNTNIKKHMVRLALYELTKNISANNVSIIRRTDYEESMDWLDRANKMKINPGLPRKLDDTGRPNLDWGIATFQKQYDPYENPWQI